MVLGIEFFGLVDGSRLIVGSRACAQGKTCFQKNVRLERQENIPHHVSLWEKFGIIPAGVQHARRPSHLQLTVDGH